MTTEVLKDLERAILEYNGESAVSVAKKVVEEGIDVNTALETVTNAIRQIGDGFGREELWLPELVAASDVMLKVIAILEETAKKSGQPRKGPGNVVIGTVLGDIHTTGKDMVGALLTAAGFIVRDLGVNVTSEQFLDALKEHNADVLAMSALMTTTMTRMKDVIDDIKEAGLRDQVKVMIGGAAITEEYAKDIGADGFDPTAPGAVQLAKRLLGV